MTSPLKTQVLSHGGEQLTLVPVAHPNNPNEYLYLCDSAGDGDTTPFNQGGVRRGVFYEATGPDGERKLIARCFVPDPTGMQPYQVDPVTKRQVFQHIEYYRRPNGTLFGFPVSESGGAQTVRRDLQVGSKTKDLYLSKPGWRWATAKDMIDLLRAGDQNAADDRARREARDPTKRDTRAAEVMSNAMVQAATALAAQHQQAGAQAPAKGR